MKYLNKAGYCLSIIGGVLAVVFSVLLIITGLLFFAGKDVALFISNNGGQTSGGESFGKMWEKIGDYYKVSPFLSGRLDKYIKGYENAFETMTASDLEDMADKYNMDSFGDLARIYRKIDAYLPKLRIGVIACLIASVSALIGAQAARKYRTGGGITVVAAGALTVIFSLLAGSILPMAAASALLIAGGLMQMKGPKARGAADVQTGGDA